MLGVLQFILKSLVARQKCRLSHSTIIKIIQKVMEYRHEIKCYWRKLLSYTGLKYKIAI